MVLLVVLCVVCVYVSRHCVGVVLCCCVIVLRCVMVLVMYFVIRVLLCYCCSVLLCYAGIVVLRVLVLYGCGVFFCVSVVLLALCRGIVVVLWRCILCYEFCAIVLVCNCVSGVSSLCCISCVCGIVL